MKGLINEICEQDSKEGALKRQEIEYQKLLVRRIPLEEKNEQRAESFMQKLKALINKSSKDKKKRKFFKYVV